MVKSRVVDFETVSTLSEALSKSKATILFISHNREFIQVAAEKIVEVGEGFVRYSRLSYEDYLHELYRKAGIKETIQNPEQKAAQADDKEARKLKQEKRKELKAEWNRLEKSISYNKAAEQRLLREYEADNFRFDRERQAKMKELRESIYFEEDKLIEVEIEIENVTKK